MFFHLQHLYLCSLPPSILLSHHMPHHLFSGCSLLTSPLKSTMSNPSLTTFLCLKTLCNYLTLIFSNIPDTIRKITMCLKHTGMSWNRLFQCFSIQTCTEKAYFSRFQYVSALCTFPDDTWILPVHTNIFHFLCFSIYSPRSLFFFFSFLASSLAFCL